jgi:hypothetical protein
MRWIDSLQDVITVLDQAFPWLLPSLESIEGLFPIQARLLICALLVCWLVSRKTGRRRLAARAWQPT